MGVEFGHERQLIMLTPIPTFPLKGEGEKNYRLKGGSWFYSKLCRGVILLNDYRNTTKYGVSVAICNSGTAVLRLVTA